MDVKEYLEIQDQWYHDQDPKKKEMIQEYNRKLIEEYPFLLPRNRWTGEVSEDYDYTWTEADSLETGWRLAFGDDLLRELKEELVKAGYLDKYRITQIKEKYGTLRWYDYGCTDKWLHEILPKYEKLSGEVCCQCGKPATREMRGWVTFMCDDCAQKVVDRENQYGSENGAKDLLTIDDRFYDMNEEGEEDDE